MLGEARVEPLVPIADRPGAVAFYRDTLGLRLLKDEPDEVVLEAGHGTKIGLYESVGAGQSRATIAAFMVDDLEQSVADLRAGGVQVEEYDFPSLKTVGGIADLGTHRAAWFKDPDGNILAVASR